MFGARMRRRSHFYVCQYDWRSDHNSHKKHRIYKEERGREREGWTRSWGGGKGREEKIDPCDTRRRVVLRTEALLQGTEEGEWRGASAPAERWGTWRVREKVQGPRLDQRWGGGKRWKRWWAKVWVVCSLFIVKSHSKDPEGRVLRALGPHVSARITRSKDLEARVPRALDPHVGAHFYLPTRLRSGPPDRQSDGLHFHVDVDVSFLKSCSPL
jgi:hypothetical protein